MCRGQDGWQSKGSRAGSGWWEPPCPEPGALRWHTGIPTPGKLLPGAVVPRSAVCPGTWPLSVLQYCRPNGAGAGAVWHLFAPQACFSAGFSRTRWWCPVPPCPWPWGGTGTGMLAPCSTRVLGGRQELLTQHYGYLLPRVEFPKISRSGFPIPSLQLDPAPGATPGSPVPHWLWARSSPQSPALPQCPTFC